jgi:uncharacterized protein
MADRTPAARLEVVTETDATAPTFIDGVPGLGLVALIATEQVRKQLGLSHHADIVSRRFPRVATFEDGALREPVRVYAGNDPEVMVLRSDVVFPPRSYTPLADCLLEDLADEFERAIFLAGAPAQTESEHGRVTGVANTDGLREELGVAGIELETAPGGVGEATGALATEFHRAGVPTALLVAKTTPYQPDPTAARSLIEEGLEPIVEIDVDTTELRKQEDEIRREMRQMADQMQEMTLKETFESLPPESEPSMFY